MMGASITATRILFFWNISLIFFQRICCSSSSTLFFFSTEITYPKINSFIISIFLWYFNRRSHWNNTAQTLDWPDWPPCFLRFSSKSYRQQVSALSRSLIFSLPPFTLTHTIRAVFYLSTVTYWLLLLSIITQASKNFVAHFLVLILYVFIGLSHPFPGINL